MDVFGRLEYWIVEPSQQRKHWQSRTLGEFARNVFWAEALENIGKKAPSSLHDQCSSHVQGVIFCNELLDAMPVHRLGWDKAAQRWFEWGVTQEREEFVWIRLGTSTADVAGLKGAKFPSLHDLPAELLQVLPDGFTIEVNPSADAWWSKAAAILASGRLVTIDYGLTVEEFFVPERGHGTLRAYYRHQPTANILARPGEQDLTSHINFAAIRGAGESAGLITETFSSQEEFLTRSLTTMRMEGNCFAEWTSRHIRQFQTLVHPDHFGRAFRVLVQAR